MRAERGFAPPGAPATLSGVSVKELRLDVSATPYGVQIGLTTLRDGLRGIGIDDSELPSVELVLAEIFNNIVEHALAETEDGVIEVGLQCTPNGLWITVEDDGNPMPDGKPPLGLLPAVDVPVCDLPEGGFGWFLIRELAHDLTYTREGDKNLLVFRMAVGRGE
ncbi:ATP-binding protein [Celeribacter arenosi]|uniref:Histidine kinase/HSP90-like ATPase domain-containing protein n=1 Tax=Celeribacter arenosi TaxID=792649 RepID=A0ABP7JWC5_9RHOB